MIDIEATFCPPKLSGRTGAGEERLKTVVPSDRKNQITGAEYLKTGKISLPELRAAEMLQERAEEESSLPRRCQRACRSLLR